MKILMVCLGNICRSPLGEGIMQDKIRRNGLSWSVDSAGTGNWHAGEQPDQRSILTAQQYGIDISTQRARQIQSADFDRFDLILTMDESNLKDVNALARKHGKRSDHICLIMNFLQPESNVNVPDPYWDDQRFGEVYQMLDLACEEIIRRFTPEK
jgi:protein-tyrosine phosphatase